MGYKANVIRGVSWMSLFRIINRILTIFKIIILARILTPSQFGVFGIATLLLAFLEVTTETGINVVLIQLKDKIDDYLDSAWVISILRGIFICLLIIFSAPFISSFFNNPASLNILLTISIIPLIKGFINPAIVNFQKNLNFNYEFLFRTTIFLLDSIVSIIFALVTHSVYSLVIGLLAGAILEVILSFIFSKPIPKFKFNSIFFWKIIHKGKWVTASSILNYLAENGDNIVVGRVLGVSSLGVYQMAYKISYSPISEIVDVINKVIFPVFSKIQSDKLRLISAFWKASSLISASTLILGGIIFIFPKEIVSIVLGEQWEPAASVLRILAIYGIVRGFLGAFSSVFLALGRQNYVTLIVSVRFLVLLITIYPLVNRFGLLGAGYSAVLSALFELPLVICFLIRIMKK